MKSAKLRDRLVVVDEALRGDWNGFHAIRVGDQWRIVFRWTEQGPAEVAIIDYL